MTRTVAALLHRLTMLSPRRRKIAQTTDLWMFTLQMSTLLGAGVDMITALGEVGWTAQGNRSPAVAIAARQVREGIRSGRSMADAMAEHEVFPPMLVSLTKAGEWSGALSETFTKAADFYTRELDHLRGTPRYCVHAAAEHTLDPTT